MNITKDQFWGAIQHLVSITIGVLAALNYLSPQTAGEIMLLVLAFQAWWNKTPGQIFNWDQLTGAAQHILSLVAAYFAAKGYLAPDKAVALPGIFVTIVSMLVQHGWNGPAATPGSSASLLLFALILPFAFSQHGCAQLEAVAGNSTVQAIAKNVAQAAINYGLAQLGDRVKETRPYIPIIEASITYAAAPTDTAASITAAIQATNAPPGIQADILSAIKNALANPPPSTTPASGPDQAQALAYCTNIAAKL